MQFPDPADPRHRAPERDVDFTGVALVSGIVRWLVRSPPAGTGNRERYVEDVWIFFERRTEECYAGLQPLRGFEHRANNLVKDMYGDHKFSHVAPYVPSNSAMYFTARTSAWAKVCLAGSHRCPSRW